MCLRKQHVNDPNEIIESDEKREECSNSYDIAFKRTRTNIIIVKQGFWYSDRAHGVCILHG